MVCEGAGLGMAPPPAGFEAFVEQKLGELERRMRDYVDCKVAEVMKLFEEKLEHGREQKALIDCSHREHKAQHNGLNCEEKLD